MERFYDGDQDQLFNEARVINPFKKLNITSRSKVLFKHYHIWQLTYSDLLQPLKKAGNGTEECEICFMVLPSSVSP